MSSTTERKRKWDQPGDEDPSAKAQKTDDVKSATAAAAAAAIAAKIAAQFAGPMGAGPSAAAPGLGGKDPHDGDFTKDIEINDVRNRYLLTKGATQTQVQQDTGASVTTKGVWYPDKSKATEKDPPLYLHISGNSQEMIDAAEAKINELIALDMGSLVEDRRRDDKPRERRKWPEEKLPVGLETIRNFNVRAKVVGPQGAFVKYIQSETQTRVQIKGIGSGFYEQETNRESDEPMHIHITGPDESQVIRAKELTEDLLIVVHQEHAKAKQAMTQQQMELQQAQAQYAAYSAYNGYAPPPPSDAPPPPPPTDAPPPPPDDGSAPPPPPSDPSAAASATNPAAPAQTAADYTAYWAAYGYDVNSEAFKQWQAQQMQQYNAAYANYAAAGHGATGAAAPTLPDAGAGAGVSAAAAPPPPSGDAPPPPPPSGDPPPPPA